jgi:predicted phosphoribosyltransferase
MASRPIFRNRTDAGRTLASLLGEFANHAEVVVLALPRGGVPVAHEIAKELSLPIDVFVVRKLGVPGHVELAFGAVAAGNVIVFNESVLASIRIPLESIEAVIRNERAELERREKLYRHGRPPIDVRDKTVIVVDDGLATGASMGAAIDALKKMAVKKIVIAVPVSSNETCQAFDSIPDVQCICAATPEPFYGVGMWYEDFAQTTDEEVERYLADNSKRNSKSAAHRM